MNKEAEKSIYILVAIGVASVVMLGFVLPYMISHESNELPIIGAFAGIIYCVVAIRAVLINVKKLIDELEKDDEDKNEK